MRKTVIIVILSISVALTVYLLATGLKQDGEIPVKASLGQLRGASKAWRRQAPKQVDMSASIGDMLEDPANEVDVARVGRALDFSMMLPRNDLATAAGKPKIYADLMAQDALKANKKVPRPSSNSIGAESEAVHPNGLRIGEC